MNTVGGVMYDVCNVMKKMKYCGHRGNQEASPLSPGGPLADVKKNVNNRN